MKILITGAKGFVGKNLVASLYNLKNGKDIEKHIFIASIESFAEENGKTILFVNGDDTNTLNDYKGIIKLILDNNVIILSENNIINKPAASTAKKMLVGTNATDKINEFLKRFLNFNL